MPMDRPIPAFYCCYLLRSTQRHNNVYVGSTPNPVRRLGQHNGIKKGGAFRTSRDSLRPWEMTCVVSGFTSHIAALQFEWAWQNPHVTLHIPSELRIQRAISKKRSGQPKRPKHTVTSLLSNLHLLLRVPSFSRWPLELRFFSEDVYKTWLKRCEVAPEPIRETINIIQDFSSQDIKFLNKGHLKSKSSQSLRGVEAIDTSYTSIKDYVEKAKEIVDFEQEGICSACSNTLKSAEGIYSICPNSRCKAVTHVTCLSQHFLAQDDESLVPIKGVCPSCSTELRWLDIIKELSLRMRGENEVEKLLKVKRVRRGKVRSLSQAAFESNAEVEEEEKEEEEEEEEDRLTESNSGVAELDGDSWLKVNDSDDSATRSSHNSPASNYRFSVREPEGLESVIQDSDWEDAEVIE